jgi:hypothetical protein
VSSLVSFLSNQAIATSYLGSLDRDINLNDAVTHLLKTTVTHSASCDAGFFRTRAQRCTTPVADTSEISDGPRVYGSTYNSAAVPLLGASGKHLSK